MHIINGRQNAMIILRGCLISEGYHIIGGNPTSDCTEFEVGLKWDYVVLIYYATMSVEVPMASLDGKKNSD